MLLSGESLSDEISVYTGLTLGATVMGDPVKVTYYFKFKAFHVILTTVCRRSSRPPLMLGSICSILRRPTQPESQSKRCSYSLSSSGGAGESERIPGDE